MDILLMEFGLVLVAGAVGGMAVRALKLPPILGYIFAGILLSFVIVNQDVHTILGFFSHLGVAFLLFMLGLELNVREVHEVGPVALTTGIGQVIITSLLGFVMAKVFGFGAIESAYIAIGLTFSSTIIIVKLLGEKGDLNSLYGRIAVGLLIVQDLIAVIALIALNFLGSSVGTSSELLQTLGIVLVVGILLIAIAFIFGRILSNVLMWIGKSSELVLVTIMAWAVLFSVFTQSLGLSLEVGAFIAGISLASSKASLEIAAKIKPLRDFFIIMFFIVLGMGLSIDGLVDQLPMILLFSVMVLVGNPLILLSIMGMMGYHRRISFLTGLTVSQISEFSLILVATGVALGQVLPETLSMVTGVAIVTLVGSSYLITQGEKVYQFFSKPLKVFEKRVLHKEYQIAFDNTPAVVVFGSHRTGEGIVAMLHAKKVSFIVIDYDPVIVKKLQKSNIHAVYGDISDPDILAELDITNVKVLISTVPSFEDNELLLGQLDVTVSKKNRPYIVMRANDREQAQVLRDHGANVVLVPEAIAGDHIVDLLEDYGLFKDHDIYNKLSDPHKKTRNS